MSERIGHFRILETLGRGGMGEVYVAQDEVLGRKVAMKSIRADRRLNAAAKARFLREARVLSSLNHPHICGIYDYVETPDSDYLVLELIEGRTLQKALRDGLDRATSLRVAEQIARVLVVAHAAGVVHRDLKPDNVMLTPSGDIKVLDFGIARQVGGPDPDDELPIEEPSGDAVDSDLSPDEIATLAIFQIEERRRFSQDESAATEIGQVIGTPMYMSPEQAWGRELTAASDMYSFGLMMQVLFTGRPPYDGSHEPLAILDAARRGAAVPVAGVGRDLGGLIRGLRALDPAARPTAAQAAERLRWIRDKPKRRIRNAMIAAVLAVAALGAVKYTVDLRRERTQAVEARNDAEGMLEFMLGDLKDRLEPVGRLDVLDAVADEALEYFSRQGDTLDDEDLFRRVRMLRLIGEVRMAEGKLADAQTAFTEMRSLADDLVSRDPTNGPWQMELGAAVYFIGALAIDEDPKRALAAFDAYYDVAAKLVELDPGNPEYQMELAYAHTNRSAALQKLDEFDAAIVPLEKANEIKRKLIASDPSNRAWRRSLGNGLSWMGALLAQTDDSAGALAQYEQELELRKELVEEDPRDTRDQRFLATAYSHVGATNEQLGQSERAVAIFRDMRGITRELVQLDPENAIWQRQLAVGHRYLARSWLSLGALDNAIAEIGAARRVTSDLLARDAGNLEWQLQEAHLERVAARVAMWTRRWADAAAATSRALELLSAQEPEPFISLQTARIHGIEHNRWLEMGWPNRAREAATRALEVNELVAGQGAAYREQMAVTLLDLGRLEEARAMLAEVNAERADKTLRHRKERRDLLWLADASASVGDHAAALGYGTAMLELCAQPDAPAESMIKRRERADAHRIVGTALRRLGRPADAIPHFETAADVAGALVTTGQDNTLSTRTLMAARRSLAGALGEAGQPDAAVSILGDTRRTLEGLVARETTTELLWRHELIELLREDAELSLRRERWSEAQSSVAAALELVLSGTTRDPDDRSVQLQLARFRLLEGRAHFGAGETVRAGAAWGRALDSIEPIAGDSDYRPHRTQLAITLLLLDRIDEAAPLVQELLPSEPDHSELMRVARSKGLVTIKDVSAQ